MSSAAFWQNANNVLTSWETNGQVSFANLDPKNLRVSGQIAAPGAGQNRKHPVVATDVSGSAILVWTEGTGWQKGGDLVWQIFDSKGNPMSERGRVKNGIPVWGVAAVFPKKDGGFVIVH